MKRFVIAVSLATVLCVPAFAGEMPIGGSAPPAPDEPTQTTGLTAPGDSPTGGYADETSTEITLGVVQTLLSLLSV